MPSGTPVLVAGFAGLYWVLVRLLRMCGDVIPSAEIADVLDRQFSEEGLEPFLTPTNSHPPAIPHF